MKHWLFALEIVNVIVVILVCLRVIYDTRSTTKTLAYLMLVVFFPVFGGDILFFVRHQLPEKKNIQQETHTG